MGKIKWIGGGLGWVFGGPIGAVLGFVFGAIFDDVNKGSYSIEGEFKGKTTVTQQGDFAVSLLILSAEIMKSDGNVVKSELEFIKDFYKRQFGIEKTKQYILLLREILKQKYDLQEICFQIKYSMDMAARLQLLHYLFGVSLSDAQLNQFELNKIELISNYLGINQSDFLSIKAMYFKDTESAYKILEISQDSTDEEIKKAYKRMALKYHPDKVSHLGEEIQHAATEKFKQINDAYNQLKNERGFN